MQDLNLKRNNIQKWVMIACVCIAGFVISPIIVATLKGIIGLIVALGISYAALEFSQYFGMVLANWKLKAIKMEASKNPIETLENLLAEKEEQLVTFRTKIKEFTGALYTFKDQVTEFKQQYPDSASQYQEQYDKMVTLLKYQEQKYRQAQDNIDQFSKRIDRARAEWKMAQASAAMNKAAGVDGDQFLDNIKKDTAFTAIQDGMNTAFAELDASLLDASKGMSSFGSNSSAAKPVKIVTEANTPKQIPTSTNNSLDLGINLEDLKFKH